MKKTLRSALLILAAVWLTSTVHAGMRIVTTEEPPTNYVRDGKFTGTTTDIVEAMRDSLGVTAEIENRPWANSYNIAKTKPNVLVFTCGRSQERIDHGFHFIGPVMTRKHIVFSKADKSFNISGIQDIVDQGLTIGAVRGDWRAKFFEDKGAKVETVAKHGNNVKKLLAGRIDLWVSSDLEAPPIVMANGHAMAEIKVAYVIKEAGSFIMISKDTPQATVDQWRGAFTTLQGTDFFDKGAAKWSQILGFELGYSKETGYFIK